MIQKVDNPNFLRRRLSAVVKETEMEKLLKQSQVASYIRDKLSSYFEEPSEFEKIK